MYAVASVLEYAARNGFKEKATAAILEHGRKRSAKEGHVIYLTMPRSKYSYLLRQMEAKGLKDHVLSVVLSKILGISLENAKNDYAPRLNNVIDLYFYMKLDEFVGHALPNIYVIDLNNQKPQQDDFKKFLKLETGSRVLVVYNGPQSSEVDGLTEKIRDAARHKLMHPYLFDQRGAIKVTGFGKIENLLEDSVYS